VQLEDGSRKAMRDVAVGDRVLVDHAATNNNNNNNKYEAVYAFAKRDADMRAEYVKLGWKSNNNNKSGGDSLEISDKHMLSVAKDNNDDNKLEWKMIPASKIEIGDKVKTMKENADSTNIATVTSIGKVQRTGAYAPLTFSGTIVASHVQASVYVSYQNQEYLQLGSSSSSSTTSTVVTYQWLAQSLFLPLRWMGAALAPFKVDLLAWLPRFFLVFEPAVLAVLALPAPVLLPLAIPFVAILGVASLLESIVLAGVDHALVLAALCLAGAVLHQRWKASGVTIRALKKKVV